MIFFDDSLEIIGHRGWPSRHPDNTLAGFAAAFEVVAMVETDIRRSADGRLILSHDPDLGGLPVSETDWSTLASLDLGDGNHPTTLDQALSAFPGGRWNLEIKNFPGEPGFEPDFRVALDTGERAGERDLLSSFFWPNVDAVKHAHPHLATALLVDEGWDLDAAANHALEMGHVAVAPHWSLLEPDPELIRRLEERGVAVVTWTLNDPVLAARLVEYGLRGMITDDPGSMTEAMR